MLESKSFAILNQEVYARNDGKLFAVERGDSRLFEFERIFFIKSETGDVRGKHAHKACSQWISVLSGEVQITLKNGDSTDHVNLKTFGELVLVPPGIWVEIKFVESSVVVVGADLRFQESDYLRVWDEYLEFRGAK